MLSTMEKIDFMYLNVVQDEMGETRNVTSIDLTLLKQFFHTVIEWSGRYKIYTGTQV